MFKYTVTMRDAKTLRVIGTKNMKTLTEARRHAKDCCRSLNTPTTPEADQVECLVGKANGKMIPESYLTGNE